MTTEIVDLLKRLEGYKQYPYSDHKGYSIGYGHFIGSNTDKWSAGVSKQEATNMLLADIALMEGYVQAYFNQSLSGRKLDAITLFCFNFGPGKLKEATFIKLIKDGSQNVAEIETWWKKWNKASGVYSQQLEQRRMMEADIWFGREIRIPDYLGGGTLNIGSNSIPNATTNTAPGADIDTPAILTKKKLPIIPIIAITGLGLIGATGGYLYFKNRPKKALSGFPFRGLPSIPFWAKIAIAGGVILTAGATYAYASKPNVLPQILPDNSTSYPQIPEQTMNAELVQTNKLLSVTVGNLAISNVVESLPKHKSKKYKSRKLDALTHIVIHHTAGNPNESIESIANYHINSTADKYPAIAYHFIILPDGSVFQTNYVTTISWHVANFNTGCIGISFTGNFDIKNNVPTEAQILSGKKLVSALQSAIEKVIGRKLLVKGHKEVAQKGHATACPGRYFPLDTFHNL